LVRKSEPNLWSKIKPLAREKRREPTPAEAALWQLLRGRSLGGYKFRRQHPIGRCIVDFYCPKARLVIEVDGEIHQRTVEEDAQRQAELEALKLRVIRFTNDEVLNQPEWVLSVIEAAVSGNLTP